MLNPNQNPETVRVKFDNEQGFCIINKDDFDAEKHALFEESATPTIDAAAAAILAESAKAAEEVPAVKPAWQS